MAPATSIFLDLLRLGAALTVFLAHTTHFWNPARTDSMQVVAHDAVILFFVLSGYVIAFTTGERNRGARHYAVARLSRLYSVVFPALLLTLLLWLAGRQLDPALYAHYEKSHPWVRFLASGFFLNEVWLFDANPPTNTPFWSLGYEFWYYVFFGVWAFVRHVRARMAVLAVCTLVVGWKVLLLMPVWLAGVAAYTFRDRWQPPKILAVTGCFLSFATTLAAGQWLPDLPVTPGNHPWYFSGAALTDFICGSGWAATIWFFDRAFRGGRLPVRLQRIFRWLGDHTFSLYLYHAPIVIMTTAVAPLVYPDLGLACVIMGGILAVVAIAGGVTERQRRHWQKLFFWLWDRAAALLRKPRVAV